VTQQKLKRYSKTGTQKIPKKKTFPKLERFCN
jgi:hypothetical protein